MPWVITNGKNYLRRNGNQAIKACSSATKAELYSDRASAEKALIGLPKPYKRLGYYISFESLTDDLKNDVKEQTVLEPVEVLTVCTEQENISNPASGNVDVSHVAEVQILHEPYRHRVPGIDDTAIRVDAFVDHATKFSEFMKSVQSQKNSLCEAHRQSDLEIQDLLHAIEFSKCNVVGGYQWYKALRETLKRRREYKDALQCMEYLFKAEMDVESIRNAAKSCAGLKNRKYTPRVLDELTSYFHACENDM